MPVPEKLVPIVLMVKAMSAERGFPALSVMPAVFNVHRQAKW